MAACFAILFNSLTRIYDVKLKMIIVLVLTNNNKRIIKCQSGYLITETGLIIKLKRFHFSYFGVLQLVLLNSDRLKLYEINAFDEEESNKKPRKEKWRQGVRISFLYNSVIMLTSIKCRNRSTLTVVIISIHLTTIWPFWLLGRTVITLSLPLSRGQNTNLFTQQHSTKSHQQFSNKFPCYL